MIEAFHVYLTGEKAHIRRERGFWRWATLDDLEDVAWDARAPQTLLNLPLTRTRRVGTLNVYLGSALCTFMRLEMPEGIEDPEEYKAIAKSHLQRQLGLLPQDWIVSLERLRERHYLVCAVRHPLIVQLEHLARQHRLRLRSVRPYISGVWNAFLEKSSETHATSLVAVESDALTVLTRDTASLTALYGWNHAGDVKLVEREIRRLELACGGETPIALVVTEDMCKRLNSGTLHAARSPTQNDRKRVNDFSDELHAVEMGAAT